MPVFQVTASVEIVARDENEAALKVETAIDRIYSQGIIGEPVVTARRADGDQS